MARHYEHILHWGNKHDGPNNYKDNRRGGAEDAFWDETELVDHKRSATKKKRARRGCPENDYKAHIYIWTTETRYYGKWDTIRGYVQDKSRPYTVDINICCGCEHVTNRRYHW